LPTPRRMRWLKHMIDLLTHTEAKRVLLMHGPSLFKPKGEPVQDWEAIRTPLIRSFLRLAADQPLAWQQVQGKFRTSNVQRSNDPPHPCYAQHGDRMVIRTRLLGADVENNLTHAVGELIRRFLQYDASTVAVHLCGQ
jgi:hypothetical protein